MGERKYEDTLSLTSSPFPFLLLILIAFEPIEAAFVFLPKLDIPFHFLGHQLYMYDLIC